MDITITFLYDFLFQDNFVREKTEKRKEKDVCVGGGGGAEGGGRVFAHIV